MIRGAIRRLTMPAAILLLLPVVASAQEAVLVGTVTDSTARYCPASRSPPCTS